MQKEAVIIMKRNPKYKIRMGVLFEFAKRGRDVHLRNVLLIAENSEDEKLLRGALLKLIQLIIKRTNC